MMPLTLPSVDSPTKNLTRYFPATSYITVQPLPFQDKKIIEHGTSTNN